MRSFEVGFKLFAVLALVSLFASAIANDANDDSEALETISNYLSNGGEQSPNTIASLLGQFEELIKSWRAPESCVAGSGGSAEKLADLAWKLNLKLKLADGEKRIEAAKGALNWAANRLKECDEIHVNEFGTIEPSLMTFSEFWDEHPWPESYVTFLEKVAHFNFAGRNPFKALWPSDTKVDENTIVGLLDKFIVAPCQRLNGGAQEYFRLTDEANFLRAETRYEVAPSLTKVSKACEVVARFDSAEAVARKTIDAYNRREEERRKSILTLF